MDTDPIEILARGVASLSALRAAGFTHLDAPPRPPTQAIGESILFRYGNDAGRTLQFVVYPQPDGDAACVVNIVNDDTGEMFGLRDWLKHHGIPGADPSRFRLANYAEDATARIEGFLSYLDTALSQFPLDDVLAGKNWEAIHFDWAGMR